jgi:lysozyme
MAMQYSKSGVQLTEKFEGCKLAAYQDQVGVWTIGYGHTRYVHPTDTCTQQQAEAWEFDALVDFAFNLGCASLNGSTLLKKLNAGDFQGAAQEFEKWSHAGGQVVAGLLRRRQAEEAEFIGVPA